jgi:tetratricopeptide (TPR) repeat protein
LKKEAELLGQTNIERSRLINEAVVEGCSEGLKLPAENSVKWSLLWYKGQALNNLGRYDEAIETLELVSEEVAYEKESSWDMVQYDLARAYMLAGGQWEKASKVLTERGFRSPEKLQNDKLFDSVKETDEYRNLFRVIIRIDGWLQYSAKPQYKNGKLLASLADTAIPLGAEVEFDEPSKKLTISKLGKVAEIQIGSSTAKVNGRNVDIGASPILLDEYYNPEVTEVPADLLMGRTLEEYKRDESILVPLDFLVELLGQKVTWTDEADEVNITEDLSRLRYSEDQRVWVNSIYLNVSVYDHSQVLYNQIAGVGRRDALTVLSAKKALVEGWGIYDRDDFLNAADWLKTEGHNSVYKEKDDYIITKYKDKLEGKGLIGWDYIRLVRLSGLAYISGYISIEESYDIGIEAAKVIQKTYSSWDEATENYIIGRGFWSGEDPADTSTVTGKMEEIRKDLLVYKGSPWNTLPWNLTLYAK